MNDFRKINNRLIKSLLIFGVLMVVVIMIVPQLINLEMMRENIENTISKEINGEIQYRHLDLSYFPRPHVVVHKVEIVIPDSFTIKMQRMKIYPKILPLFLGRLQAGEVTLEYADYVMQLPQMRREAPKQEQLASIEDILAAITKAIRGLPEFKLPEMKLRINSGKINLVDPFGHEFKLRAVQAAYQRQSDELDFSIKCKSNLWDQIDVNGALNPLEFKGKGQIRLSRFRPQALIAYLMRDSALQVTDAKANLAIDVELAGMGSLKADVEGAVPLLALSLGEEEIVVKGGRIRGAVQIAEKTVGISLTEMGLDYPKLVASGKFSYDESLPDIQLAVDGSGIDAAAVRQVALGLAGQSKTIRNIFKIIRGGYVPWMTVRTQGHQMAELGMLDNIIIKGRMTQGNIFIPGAELYLDGVIGDALISAGILHGENLEAQMGSTSGRDGNMTLGFNKNLAPFHLNISVNADLSQLPPVLGRVVKNKDFLKELALINDVKGTATGVLILGDDLPSLSAEVQASDIHLAARYKRLSYPVEIEGGHFNYARTRLAFDNFKANIGKSSFLNSSMVADWTELPDLNVNSQAAKINLNELYNWLQSHDILKKILNNMSGLKGEAAIDSLEIKGPFFSPRNWRFKTRGVVNELILTSDKLPKSLEISRGHFTWQETNAKFSDVDAQIGKSSIRNVAGDVNWAKTPLFSARSGRAVFHLEDIGPLIFSHNSIATALERFNPISGTLAFKRMTVGGPVWQPSIGRVSFSADVEQFRLHSKRFPIPLRIDHGKFSLRKNRFTVNEIDLSLGNSNISRFSADVDLVRPPTFEAHSQSVVLAADELFPWLLSFEDRDSFLKDFSVNKGRVFLPGLKLSGPLHHPTQWHYALTCDMKNLVLNSDAFGDPVTVNRGSFDLISETTPNNSQNKIRLNETELVWGENHMTLVGAMIISPNDTLLNLTLTAAGIDWNQVNNIVDYAANKIKESSSQPPKRSLRGTLDVQAENFNYETFTVSPLKADLSFMPDKVVITLSEAVVCNISFQGRLNVDSQTLEINLIPTAVNQLLAPAVSCITEQEQLATGTFDLNGHLQSNSRWAEFPQSLSGELVLSAEKGRINRFGLLAKILSILNVTEIYRGELPDLTGKGFAYHGLKISANLKGSKLIMQECAIDGVSMGIACEGDIDIAGKEMNLIILVAPFKTVDRIVKVLPLLKHVLGGKLISIPFRAKGDLTDPEVIPLPPTAIGSGVLGILERTLKLPITIMQPVFSLGKNEKKDRNSDEDSDPSGLP
jgi:hypothetical protein